MQGLGDLLSMGGRSGSAELYDFRVGLYRPACRALDRRPLGACVCLFVCLRLASMWPQRQGFQLGPIMVVQWGTCGR